VPNDQVILDVKVTGQPAVDKLKESVSTLKALVGVLDEELAADTITTAEYTKEVNKLNTAIRQQETSIKRLTEQSGEAKEETRRLAEETKRLKEEQDKVSRAADEQRAATKKVAQGMLDLSRAGQDLVQGGFGAVINNMEGIGRALGNIKDVGIGSLTSALMSPAGFGAALMAVGTAAYFAWPHLRDFFKYMNEADPEKAKAMAELLDTMAGNTDKLKAQLRDLLALNDPYVKALDSENKALERRVELEKTRIEQQDRAKKEAAERAEAVEKAKGEPSAEEKARKAGEAERAKAIEKIVGGPELAEIEQALMRTLPHPREASFRKEMAQMETRRAAAQAAGDVALEGVFHKQMLEREQEFLRARLAQAKDVAGRFQKGEDEAIAKVVRALPEGPMQEQLRRLTAGARFAAGARQAGRDVLGIGRELIEGEVGQVTGLMGAAQAGLRGLDQRNQAIRERRRKARAQRRHEQQMEEEEALTVPPEEQRQVEAIPAFEGAVARMRVQRPSETEWQEGVKRAAEARERGMPMREAGESAVQQMEEARKKAREEFVKPRQEGALEQQVNQLMQQGPQIAGASFGPQAAEAARRASPAEVQDIREKTLRNLKGGEAPYQAVLNALMDVYQASERNQQQAADFTGRLNGLRDQAKSHTKMWGN
jgi:hypothetical protein